MYLSLFIPPPFPPGYSNTTISPFFPSMTAAHIMALIFDYFIFRMTQFSSNSSPGRHGMWTWPFPPLLTMHSSDDIRFIHSFLSTHSNSFAHSNLLCFRAWVRSGTFRAILLWYPFKKLIHQHCLPPGVQSLGKVFSCGLCCHIWWLTLLSH